MNIFEEVNKELDKLLEGDVVSFTDFKRAKEVAKAIKGAYDEVIHVTIEGVNTQNYAVDGTAILESGVLYGFKELQTIFYALDKLQEGEGIPFKYKAGMIAEENGKKERFVHEGYVTIGQGVEQANMLNELEPYMDKVCGKTTIFDGDLIPLESDVQKKVKELQKVLDKKEIKVNTELAPAKDYSNGDKKFGQDVETGDILYYSYNYGSTQHYFIKVLERKGQTLKLAKLKKSVDLRNDDDGRVVPTNEIMPDRDIDGKVFRVHKSKGDWDNVVCKIDDRNCYYWDGVPKRETYMD